MKSAAVLRKTTVNAFRIALLAAAALAQDGGALEPGFQERAMAHVRQLAAPGGRVAGGEGEAKAAIYVKQQMANAGLDVVVEPFEFESFALESAVLTVGTEHADILRLAFNPYTGGDRRTGELAFVESTGNMSAVLKMELDGKIVVTTQKGNLYILAMFKKPRAIAMLPDPEFRRLRALGVSSGEIVVRGKVTKTRSANVVGSLPSGSGAGREIVLSAHYDSWKGPGANDNASGVAVLLELARHFRSLKPDSGFAVRFVAFGAEEVGLMGAKAYLEKHRTDLQRCRLLFNIDSVGGKEGIYADTQPARQDIAKLAGSASSREPADKATGDLEHRWMLIGMGQSPLAAGSTVPEWLRAAVSEAGRELGIQIQSSSGMGSDHRVFFQAGVVATDIAIAGGELHTPGDVPESVSAQSMETAARIVSLVVEKAIRPGD